MSRKAMALFVAEPPAQYLVRPPVVVDCSVMAALLFREEGEAQALAQMSARTLHAPFLLQVEMASVALKKQRHDHIEQADEILLLLEQTDLTYHPNHPTLLLSLASDYNLSAHDAAYLSLASQLKCPLLTFDERLAKAAKTHLSTLQ
jgi:predicted nucleic acid-binding protein